MATNRTILLKLLDAADQLESLLGEAWPSVRETLAQLIARSEAEGDSAALSSAVDTLLAQLLASPAASLVRQLMSEVPRPSLPTRGRGGGAGADKPVAPATEKLSPEERRWIEIPVYYATDRRPQPEADLEDRYADERGSGSLAFGVASVSVPFDHRIGEMERPRWWRLEFRQDPAKHVVLLDLAAMERGEYVAALREAIGGADSRDVLLFVHGYNVTFTAAARRTAQLTGDLRFSGRTLLYSWPSRGRTLSYTADEATIEWAVPHFEEFLRLVLTEIGAATVHVIAHSMGNRALTRVIERVDVSRLPPGSARLRQVVLAAPDIDRDVFVQIAAAFHGRAERFTLYASRHDLALRLSKLLHRGPRAGDAKEAPVIIQGVDSIDASDVDTSLLELGHSYWGDERSILDDIFALLKHGTPPDERFELMEAVSPLGKYWRYRP